MSDGLLRGACHRDARLRAVPLARNDAGTGHDGERECVIPRATAATRSSTRNNVTSAMHLVCSDSKLEKLTTTSVCCCDNGGAIGDGWAVKAKDPCVCMFTQVARARVGRELQRDRKATLSNQIPNVSLTERTCGHSIRTVQVCRSVGRPRGNPVRFARCESNPELPPQLSAVSPSPKCHWVLRCKACLPCKTWEGGEGRRPASQETCLSESSFHRAGSAIGADFRRGDKENCRTDGGRHGWH